MDRAEEGQSVPALFTIPYSSGYNPFLRTCGITAYRGYNLPVRESPTPWLTGNQHQGCEHARESGVFQAQRIKQVKSPVLSGEQVLWLLSQRTQVQFRMPAWHLTTACNSCFRRIQFPYTDICALKITGGQRSEQVRGGRDCQYSSASVSHLGAPHFLFQGRSPDSALATAPITQPWPVTWVIQPEAPQTRGHSNRSLYFLPPAVILGNCLNLGHPYILTSHSCDPDLQGSSLFLSATHILSGLFR